MPNPENGPEQQGLVGSWQTVSLGVPDFLQQVRQTVDAFFSALIQLLNILLAILEVIKAFAIGFLDPIIAIIEGLLKEVEALLNDLRNAGLYIHGDFYILDGPEFSQLLGGYSAYEKRMISRFVDSRDPNRPNVSSQSTVLAVFLYLSVDLTSAHRLVSFIRGILALFNRKIDIPKTLSIPVNVRAKYGLDGASVFAFKKSFFPDARFRNTPDIGNGLINRVNLTWQMAPAAGGALTNFAQLPPRGFLVEFSTLIQPLALGYDKPVKGSQEANSADASQPAPKRTGGTCVDQEGNPVLITGGADSFNLDPSTGFNQAVGLSGDLKPLSARYYLIKNLSDPTPIPPEDLRQGDNYYLQRTFFVPFGQNLFFPGKGYGATFDLDSLPFSAEWELDNGKAKRINDKERGSRFFVRVRAVSNRVNSANDWRYDLTRVALDTEREPVVVDAAYSSEGVKLSLDDVGAPSAPFEIVFPTANTEQYLRCVASALALLVLSRSDLPVKSGSGPTPEDGSAAVPYPVDYPPQEGQLEGGLPISSQWASFSGMARKPTQLENLGQTLLPQLIGRKRRLDKYFLPVTEDVVKWRQDLYYRCLNLAQQMYRTNRPSATIEQIVINSCQDLLDYNVAEAAIELEGTDFSSNPLPSSFSENASLEGMGILDFLLDERVFAGIAPNRKAVFNQDTPIHLRKVLSATGNSQNLRREPHFFVTEGRVARGSVDDGVPVVYQVGFNTVYTTAFLRNLIPDEVYSQAALALRVSAGPAVRPQEKGWIAFRLFPGGLPDVDRFFDELLAMLRSIKQALQAISDLIRQFIEFLQSRIIELQALLNRINALIQNLLNLFISIPAVSGLVTIAPGTDGTLAALVSSQNKPFDNPSAYGGGVVLLAGGIPTIAIDIFKALVSGSD